MSPGGNYSGMCILRWHVDARQPLTPSTQSKTSFPSVCTLSAPKHNSCKEGRRMQLKLRGGWLNKAGEGDCHKPGLAVIHALVRCVPRRLFHLCPPPSTLHLHFDANSVWWFHLPWFPRCLYQTGVLSVHWGSDYHQVSYFPYLSTPFRAYTCLF